MISPANQKIIQIDITNACVNKCSNCTRFCGHHDKPYMMDFPAFAQAVDSLRKFPGMVGVMGGEPTLHPEFRDFAMHLREVRPEPDESSRKWLKAPLSPEDFVLYRKVHLSHMDKRRGLWSAMGKRYFESFELIQESFPYQCLNDHHAGGSHQALLVARKDLGIPDSEWIPRRDNCWLQRKWSASITPKGAFFCEVAGALDMLFDGPGGWPVKPGWWNTPPEEFGDQLHWCELCSVPLRVPHTVDSEETDTISHSVLRRLQAVRQSSEPKKKVKLFTMHGYKPEDYPDLNASETYEPYLKDGDERSRMAGAKGRCACATTRALSSRPPPEIAATTASMPSAEVPDIKPTMNRQAPSEVR